MSEMPIEFYDTHAAVVRKVARAQHKGATFIDMEDIEQAVWLFMAQNYEAVKGYSPEGIRAFATKTAKKFCAKERVDHMYFRGNFIYTPDMVEVILTDSAWVELEHGVDVDGRVDVREAFETLTETQAKAVFKKFALGESLTNAERDAARRGVETITHRLNVGVGLEAVEIEAAAREV